MGGKRFALEQLDDRRWRFVQRGETRERDQRGRSSRHFAAVRHDGRRSGIRGGKSHRNGDGGEEGGRDFGAGRVEGGRRSRVQERESNVPNTGRGGKGDCQDGRGN